MLIFTFSELARVSDELIRDSALEHADFKIKRFPNQEFYIILDTNVLNKECLILGTIAPPDENLLSILSLSHTLKKEGALKVTLVLPYLAYSRQDKPKPKESMATSLIGSMLSSAGVDKVVTVDVHSVNVASLFPIPLISISPTQILGDEIERLKMLDATLVAPDKNALKKAEEIIKLNGMIGSTAYLEKERITGGGIRHLSFHGQATDQAIIIDDMLDTGETIISCAEQLVKAGVKEIVVMVTHGLFTGEKWKKLFDLRVKKIYCTDTIPQKVTEERIKILSVVPLLKRELGFEVKS